MAYTYSKIASYTVGSGGISSINFIAIPQTYTDLVIKISGRSARASQQVDNLFITFNSNTSPYSSRIFSGTGTSTNVNAYSARYASLAINAAGSTASTFSNQSIYIPNYTGDKYKSFASENVSENNATAAQMDLVAGIWSNSSPIFSISLSPEVSTWVQHTTATLYGIKAEL